MAGKGFIDTDMANRGARGGSSEGANAQPQVRNNQVITGARAKTTRPPTPLTIPTPPPVPQAADTSTPGNAAANIAAAIATRPSPPLVRKTPPPAPPAPNPPPAPIEIFIPPSIPDVQSTITPLGPMLESSGDGAVNPPPGPPGGGIQYQSQFTLPLGPVDIEIITEGGSGGDEIVRVDNRPPVESFPPPPPPNPIVEEILAQVVSEPPISTPPPPIEEVIEQIVEQTLQTPKEDPPAPVQTTVQIPEPKPSTPVVAPPRPKIKKSTDVPKPKPGYITKPNGFIKKPQEPVVDVVFPPKVSGPGSPTKPGGLAATLVGTGKPKVTAPSDDAVTFGLPVQIGRAHV